MEAAPLGEGCWLFELPGPVGPGTTRRVLAAHRRVSAAGTPGVPAVPGLRDVVPGLTSLAVHFDPAVEAATVRAAVEGLLLDDPPPSQRAPQESDPAPGPTHTLPTRFDGPDLAAVANAAGLSIAATVAAFAARSYTVAAIGFLPHFPYLLGLDPRLATPRRASPRKRVPAGSVAIGNDQAGVYPRESPGGWNLLGTTDPALLEAIRPGDEVRFVAAEVEADAATDAGAAS